MKVSKKLLVAPSERYWVMSDVTFVTIGSTSLPVPPTYESWKVLPPDVNVLPSDSPAKVPPIAPVPLFSTIVNRSPTAGRKLI
jgi:hypothetical protein